ncbi:hypothetical protein OAM07_00020 [Crocinitomicaceae bacterium]|nr:hypothetical protein [Crocinitomicaceae bacterium]
MEEKYAQIFSKSSFHELTDDEKNFISELCSNEDEFESVKHLYSGMETLSDETIRLNSASVKRQLDQEFKEIHASEGGFRLLSFLFPPIKPLYAKPGLQIAFLLVFIFTLYYSVNNMSIDNQPKQLYSQNEIEKKESPKEVKSLSKDKAEIDLKTTNEESLMGSNESLELVEDNLNESISIDTETRLNGAMMAEMISDVEEDSFSDDMTLFAPTSAPTTAGIAIAGFDRPDDNEAKFIIEPIGEDLGLLEDLFVTF